ncbi:PAS domain S-box protein, partial [Candidatus Latescibacterota bacterium]
AQMNSTLEGIIVVDPDGKKILQNNRTAELWKIPQHIVDNIDDNIQVQHVKNMTIDPEKFVEKIKYLYIHPNETIRDEIELIDGTTLDRYSAPVLGKDGKNHGRIWTFLDITERKNAVEALKKSKSDLSQALYVAKMGHWEFNTMENQFTFTDEFYSLFHTSAEKMGGYTMSPEKYSKLFVHPDDISVVSKAMQESNDTDYRRLAEHRILYADGGIGYIDVYIRIVKDENGQTIKAYGVNQDITERKMLEKELANAVTLLEAQMNSTLEGIIVVDPDGKKILQNKRTAELWKIPQHIADNIDDNIQVQHVMNMTLEPEKFVENIKYLYSHPNETTHDEIELIDGTTLDRYSAPVIGKDDENHGRIWTFLDITERKNAEEALKKSKSDLSQALYVAKMGHWEFNVLENQFTFTDEFYSIYHTSAAKMGGYTMSPERYAKLFVHQDDVKEVSKEIRKLIETSDPLYKRLIEHRMLYIDGSIGYIEVHVSIIKDEDGRTIKSFGVSHDITERKKAEVELRESERKLREAQEMAHLGFWSWDVKTGDVEWSEEVYKIFGLDPEKFTPQINSILELSPWPEDFQRDKELINKAIESQLPGDYEQSFQFPDKSTGHYYSTFKGNYDENGNLTSIVGTVLDITERKKAEEAIIASLAEKEILLKEIHHRVKNNLAVVSSLLSKQADLIEDKQYLAIFNESVNRIKAMSQIHEILYKSDDFSRIDFKEYVKGINNSIADLHMGRRGIITLKSVIKDVYLN